MALVQDSAPENTNPEPKQDDRAKRDGAPGGTRDGRTNLFGILSRTGGMSINPTVRKYNEEILEEVQKVIPQIDMRPLQSPPGTMAYFLKRGERTYVFLVIPTMGIQQTSTLRPSSERIADALSECKSVFSGDVHVLSAQLYADRDMILVGNMASLVSTCLATYADPDIRHACAADFTSDLDWVVDPSVTAAEEFVAERMPTIVRPPADFGFVFGVRKARDNDRYDRYRDDRDNGDNSIERLIGVTAYTEFLGPWKDPKDGSFRFQPVIHGAITASPLMLPVVENLALAQLVQQGIIEEGWQQAFRRFSLDGGQNIGTLMEAEDDRTQLFRVKNMGQFDDMMRYNMFEPILVIDVMDGYYRVPSRLCYTNRSKTDTDVITREAARFFDVAVPDLENEPSAVIGREYVGTYGEGSNLVDSRKFTYLEMARRGAPEAAHREIMLEYQRDERIRADLIADLNPGFRSEYLNRITLIDPGYMAWLSGAIKTSGMTVFNQYTRNSVVPMAGYVSKARDYSRFQSFTYQRDNRYRGGFDGYRL